MPGLRPVKSYRIPNKYGNPICEKCHGKDHDKYQTCISPCAVLVAYASAQVATQVIEDNKEKWD